ncbi:molybdate ABC transporter substrate-binding protein [Desulfoferrobacter suflitae]|uniref:molybdate ABC transporter substrate-binding protein n=1 Tax=Desulfoferrobacter suflitae TaxID=2865782 RepID=UPI002164B1B6|nr:molybdate ABC transporter substrate-binding protein [Desulfoferrobacter suflitae]MCK8602798.1 molybdate ABC transporter substrate-binding protein [Desulfoferrobacter suflitae]
MEQIRPPRIRVLALLWTVILSFGSIVQVQAEPTDTVVVFAAASTTDSLNEIGKLFAQQGGGKFVPSFAASSTLAKQIEHGAPANVFLSANVKWMDYLQEKNFIAADGRFDLLGNRIVLIAPADSEIDQLDIRPGLNLAALLGNGRLAMGDPEHVPAGMYGKQALEKLGIWHSVADKIAPAKDVRAALALVERAEAPLGLVYATDAAVSEQVKVIGVFPEDSHPPIVYPVALVAGNQTEVAKRFMDFLRSAEPRRIFEKFGFTVR